MYQYIVECTCKTYKKSLKQSEAVNRRSTDNTMAKRKRAIGQTTIYKTLHGKLMIEQHESGVNSGAQEW